MNQVWTQAHELDQIARFQRASLPLEDERPLVVEGFQRRMLADYFAGATESIILWPKKQASRRLFAAIALERASRAAPRFDDD